MTVIDKIEEFEEPVLNIMALIEESRVNGPGSRFVIWTQGCGKGCKGCFNPESWNFRKRHLRGARDLAQIIRDQNPYGLTLSGGDPLEQPIALLTFLRALHEPDNTLAILPGGIIMFTGYTREEIFEDENIPNGLASEEEVRAARDCWALCDLVIDGRFVQSLRYESALAGSSNQRFWFSSEENRGHVRVPEDSVLTDQAVEVHEPDAGGLVNITGFPDIDHNYLKLLGLRVIYK